MTLLVPTNSVPFVRSPDALVELERRVGCRLPHALGVALTTHAWGDEAEFGEFVLFPNPPGPALDGFWSGMDYGAFRDQLLAAGFVPFCRWDASFDPVCVDVRGGDPERAPVVGLLHEPLLMYRQTKVARRFAPSFAEWLRLGVENEGP